MQQFQQGLNVVANNIANVETVGFKSASINFADTLSQTLSGPGSGGTSTVNIGVTKDQMKEFDQIQSGLTASTQTALQEMAESTGGFFMGDSNDFRKPMRRLMEDVQCYYEAAYTPNIGEYDGHFRKIAVRMKRPRVTVQTRSGYYALPASTRAASPFEMPMLKVLNSGTLPTAFPFRWKVLHFRREAGQVVGDLVVEVPISALQIDEDHSSKVFKVQLSILALIKNPAGGVIEKLSQDIPYQGALEMLERTRGGDVIFEKHFRAPAGNYTVELAVYDRNAAAMSAIKAPFDIPPAFRSKVRNHRRVPRCLPEYIPKYIAGRCA